MQHANCMFAKNAKYSTWSKKRFAIWWCLCVHGMCSVCQLKCVPKRKKAGPIVINKMLMRINEQIPNDRIKPKNQFCVERKWKLKSHRLLRNIQSKQVYTHTHTHCNNSLFGTTLKTRKTKSRQIEIRDFRAKTSLFFFLSLFLFFGIFWLWCHFIKCVFFPPEYLRICNFSVVHAR